VNYKIIYILLVLVVIGGCGSSRTNVSECELTREECQFYDMTKKFISANPEFEKDPVKIVIVDRTNGQIFIAVQTIGGIRHGFGVE
jgi:hypothetical protein